MNIWQELPKPFFVLAPMDDVTDSVFRQIIAECHPPDLFFTEFASVDGLQSAGRRAVLQKLKFSDKEKPIIAQIWGLKPENYFKTAQDLAAMGFDGIDINMGCPDRTVVKNGCCSALINDRSLAAEIITATQEGANKQLPVSVKTRIGFDKPDIGWAEFLLSQRLAALTMHGRTTKQMSRTANNWQFINQVRQIRDAISMHTAVVGNGDVLSVDQGKELAKRYQLDGIMIGRGIFQNPYLFDATNNWQDASISQKLELYAHHIELFADVWGTSKNPQIVKKFAKVYVNNFPGASDSRAELMNCSSLEELLDVISTSEHLSVKSR